MINPEVEQGFERSAKTQELWQGQQEAKVAIQDAHDNGITRGYLHMATGTGKTRVVAEDVARKIEAGETERVLYLCHNGEILRQAHNEFEKVLGDSNSHSYMFGGEFEDNGDVVYATFQTMTRKLGGGQAYEAFDPDEFDYIAIDEGHHSAAETYRPVIEYFNPKFLTAMTATPRRRDNQLIEDIVGPELFSLPLDRAIAEGYVTPVNYKILTDHVKTLPQLKAEGVKLDINKLDEQIFVPKSDEEIIDSISEELSEIENPRTAVFCSTIANAEKFAEMYPGEVSSIHSKLDPDEVKNRIQKFRSGETPMVVTVGMFDEGIDLPEINSVVFLRQTESETIWLQQLGRGLRKAEGKDEVKVLDYVGSFARLSRIHDLIGRISSYRGESASQSTTSFIQKSQLAFRFNMSEEAKRCEEIIRVAQNRIKVKPLKQEKVETEETAALRARLNIPAVDSRNTGEFRALEESQWKYYAARIQNGDERLKERVLDACLHKMFNLAKIYPEQNGLTIEDYFMSAYEGYLEAMSEGYPSADKETYLGHLNGRGRTAITEMIKSSALLSGSMAPHVFGDRKSKNFSDPSLAIPIEDVSEESSRTETPVDELVSDVLDTELLLKPFSLLPDIEQKVLKMRYGMGQTSPLTLDQVGSELGLTRERVREIEMRALKSLKKDSRADRKRAAYNYFELVQRSELAKELIGLALNTGLSSASELEKDVVAHQPYFLEHGKTGQSIHESYYSTLMQSKKAEVVSRALAPLIHKALIDTAGGTSMTVSIKAIIEGQVKSSGKISRIDIRNALNILREQEIIE